MGIKGNTLLFAKSHDDGRKSQIDIGSISSSVRPVESN